MADETTDIFEKRTGSFNISNFRSKIKGEAFASKFYFKFSDPFWNMFDGKEDLIKNLFFYSDEGFQIPARRIDLNNEYRYATGFKFATANQTRYGDGNITISFRLDGKYDVYKIFNNWINKIHDQKTGFLKFYDEYTTSMEAYQLNHTTEVLQENNENPIEEIISKEKFIFRVKITKCFPIAISSIDFSHQANNPSKVSVDLTYSGLKYEDEDFD